MRRASAKTAKRNADRRDLMAQWFEEAVDPYLGFAVCEVQWDRGCTGRATDGHEPLTRARGGDVLDRANVLLACRHCHDKAHANQPEAHARGILVHSWEGAKAR